MAKAVGIKGDYLPDVVDATAGLGRDAFVLASVGCRVRMLERNPVVAALLDDGLARGYADAEIGGWLQERLQLIHASSLTALTDITPRPQVVYLDPMFPHKQKSALVKKEMRVFQSLVGPDLDADGLLEPARLLATKRVVVKRPDYAPPLANVATPNAVVTKGHRLDIVGIDGQRLKRIGNVVRHRGKCCHIAAQQERGSLRQEPHPENKAHQMLRHQGSNHRQAKGANKQFT